MKLSKDCKEWLRQQTFLCPAVRAFLTPLRCGIHCEYAPNAIFHSGVCVHMYVWDLKENDDTGRALYEHRKTVTLQSDRVARSHC